MVVRQVRYSEQLNSKVSETTAFALDKTRGSMPRSEWIRNLINKTLGVKE